LASILGSFLSSFLIDFEATFGQLFDRFRTSFWLAFWSAFWRLLDHLLGHFWISPTDPFWFGFCMRFSTRFEAGFTTRVPISRGRPAIAALSDKKTL